MAGGVASSRIVAKAGQAGSADYSGWVDWTAQWV